MGTALQGSQGSLRKCGTTVALDGSEDSDINIGGLEGYIVGTQSSDSEDTSSDSDDDYEPGSNFGDTDAVGEGVIVGKGDAGAVGREVQQKQLGVVEC